MSDHENTQGKRRRLDSKRLKAMQFDTQMQSTFFERNDDMMNLGEMSLHIVGQQYFTEDKMLYITNSTNHYAHEDCNDPNLQPQLRLRTNNLYNTVCSIR